MGIISRILGQETTATARVDDFVRVGSSVKSKKVRSQVAQVAQTLRDMDFENLQIEFQGQDTVIPNAPLTTIGKKIRGADVVRHSVAGVFTNEAVESFGLGGISGGVAHHAAVLPGSEKHKQLVSFFRSQGIDVPNPDEVRSFLFYESKSIGKSLPDNLLLVGHEVRTCCR